MKCTHNNKKSIGPLEGQEVEWCKECGALFELIYDSDKSVQIILPKKDNPVPSLTYEELILLITAVDIQIDNYLDDDKILARKYVIIKSKLLEKLNGVETNKEQPYCICEWDKSQYICRGTDDSYNKGKVCKTTNRLMI